MIWTRQRQCLRNNLRRFKSKSVSSWNLGSNIRKSCKIKRLFRYRGTRKQLKHVLASNQEKRISTVAIILKILLQQRNVKSGQEKVNRKSYLILQ